MFGILTLRQLGRLTSTGADGARDRNAPRLSADVRRTYIRRTKMGLGRRVFLVSEDDQVKRCSVQQFDRLHSRDGRLPELATKKLKYIHVLVATEDRRPTNVLNIECGLLVLNRGGALDSDAEWDKMKLAVNMIESGYVADDVPAVVNARHLFAKREYEHKYRWTPSKAVLRQVGHAIFGG
jgi:hypothetical protein